MNQAKLGTSAQHQLAGKITEFLVQNRFLETQSELGELFPAEQFQSVRQLVNDRFYVDQTSITPLMARTLFSIAYHFQPKRILFIGSYMGNALVWLATPSHLPVGAYEAERIIGLDLNEEANQQARSNFERLFGCNNRVVIENADAYEWVAQTEETFDLVFLDIDEPDRGKKGYLDLLKLLQSKLSSDALILAHDIVVEKFLEDLKPYLEFVQDKGNFQQTLSLKIDAAGLEITQKKR